MEIIVNHAEIHALMGEYLKIFIQYALPFGLFLGTAMDFLGYGVFKALRDRKSTRLNSSHS